MNTPSILSEEQTYTLYRLLRNFADRRDECKAAEEAFNNATDELNKFIDSIRGKK